MLIQSYDWFVAQGITRALKSGNCLPPSAGVCVCVLVYVSLFMRKCICLHALA